METRRRRLFAPVQLLRQAGAVVLYGLLTRWRNMSRWLLTSNSLMPLVAGSKGMGCIGFPVHPVIEVTARCNLQCVHCHAESNDKDQPELSTDAMRRILRETSAQSEFKMVVFSGGEPLMREDLVELCYYARRLGLWVVLATNGTLLDRELAARLRRAGVVGIAVGMDGDCPAIHDEVRGVHGAFRQAIEGCVAARREGLVLQVNITLMQQNRQRLAEIVRLAEHLRARVVLAYFCAPCGRGERNRDILLSPEQYETTVRQLAEVQRSSKLIIEPVCAPTFWAMLGARNCLSRLAVKCFGTQLWHGCVAGSGLFYIRADGEALPCPFIPISAGNVLDKGVSNLWEHGEVFETLRRLKVAPEAPSCSECEFARVCGGCRSKALSAYGDLAANDPFCFLSNRQDNCTDAPPPQRSA